MSVDKDGEGLERATRGIAFATHEVFERVSASTWCNFEVQENLMLFRMKVFLLK